MNSDLGRLELQIRQKAAHASDKRISDAVDALLVGVYGGVVPRLTLRVEVENDEGTIKITHRAPTIREVADLLRRSIQEELRRAAEDQAVNAAVNKLSK